jgi:Tol biopolymer transport system component
VSRFGTALALTVAVVGACAARGASPSATIAPSDAAAPSATPPDGRIAFARTEFDPATNTPTGGDIWSVATDGSDLLRLTDTPEIELFPAWSPDAARIAFVRLEGTTNGDIWLIDADPTAADRHLTRLTDSPGLEGVPVWSPDGRSIAYVDDWQGAASVWIRSADGADDARRVNDGNWPSWTPDGTRLLITVGAEFTDTELAYVAIDGGDPEVLPIDVPNASEGAVGPNGEVAFVSSVTDYADTDPSTWNEEIYTTSADGRRGPTRVTDTPENDHWPPSWAPTGDWLAYTNDQATKGSRIAVVLPTGEPTYITEGSYDLFPAWRPEPAS